MTHLRLATVLLLAAVAPLCAGCDDGQVTLTADSTCAGDCSHGGGDGLHGFVDGAVVITEAGPLCGSGTTPCGLSCCTADQLCVSGTCKDLGDPCDELWPCPKGSFCDKALGRCVPGASPCEYRPPVGVFNPSLEWEWTGSTQAPSYNQVMMTPMVANLTDDNGDGSIDRDDIPDIVFATFAGSNYTKDGVLRVVSGDGSKEHFAITPAEHRVHPGAQVALGDIDGDGKPEIVACASGGGIIAFGHKGGLKWKTAGEPCNAPALADLDGDGTPEVVVCYAAYEGATGKLRWRGRTGCGTYITVADLDEDGKPEVVGGNAVYRSDGKLYWEDATRPDGYVAVADLDGDGKPEVITASSSDHSLRAVHHDGSKYWGPVDINQGNANLSDKCGGCGGGPPTVADFDGDTKAEIAAAAGYGYVVFEHDGSPKWFKATQDLSSRVTGSSVFDFEGDGKAEVVYGDELELKVYDGQSGKVLISSCNTSGTLQEYPVVVDVDNDMHAEIVVANNNYAFKSCSNGSASHTGIKVLGDVKNNWVRTRRIWNQHTYHVTNIDEDGKVPAAEPRNWDNPALNNFRQNVQPGGLFDAPDLQGAAGQLSCGGQIVASGEVKNEGAAKVLPGLKVTLYLDDPASGPVALQTVSTTGEIYPGGSETVTFTVQTPAGLGGQTIELYMVVDDDGSGGAAPGSINECKEDNNKVLLGQVTCQTIG